MPDIVSTTFDPDGRLVHLAEKAWRHIKEDHAPLARKLREIMAAVREPVVSVPGRAAHEVWFLGEDAGRFPWLQVVVHYEGGEGWIVTAFPNNVLPRR